MASFYCELKHGSSPNQLWHPMRELHMEGKVGGPETCLGDLHGRPTKNGGQPTSPLSRRLPRGPSCQFFMSGSVLSQFSCSN